MARRLVWPLPDDKDRPWWRERLERWHELPSEERLEVLRAWCEDQDGRQGLTDAFVRFIQKIWWLVVAAFVVVATQTIWSHYQIIRTGQVVIPAPKDGASLFPDRVPRPAAPAGQ